MEIARPLTRDDFLPGPLLLTTISRVAFTIALMLLVVLGSSCSSVIRYRVPLSSMQTSETVGQREGESPGSGFNLQVSPLRSDFEVELSPDYATTLVANSTPQIGREDSLGANFDIGVLDRLDLGVRPNGNSLFTFGAKALLLGTSQARARSGDFSLSAFTDFGRSSGTVDRGNDDNLFSNGVQKHEYGHRLFAFGLAAGYRPITQLLIYLSGNRSFQKAWGEQTLRDGTGPVSYTRHGRMTAGHVGTRFHLTTRDEEFVGPFFIQPEVTRAVLQGDGFRTYKTALQIDLGWNF